MALDPDLRQQISRAVLVVTGIAAAIGFVVAVTATVALDMAGISGGDGPAPKVAQPEPVVPSPPAPSQSPSDDERAEAGGPGEDGPDTGPRRPDTDKATVEKSARHERRKPPGISLRAGTSTASAMERVTLIGRYPEGDGTSLRVQRREGGSWAAFPTSATVEGGSFRTYVALGQPGPNKMRVVDPRSGRTSNVVTIMIS